jgi:hypothetical protein
MLNPNHPAFSRLAKEGGPIGVLVAVTIPPMVAGSRPGNGIFFMDAGSAPLCLRLHR